MKYDDDIKRKALKDIYADTEIIDMPKPFRQRKEGKKRKHHTLESLVEQERTYPDKPKADRFKHIKKFLKKQ